MTGLEAVLNDIISLLTGGISGMAKGIGSGLKELVTEIFLETTEQGEVTGASITAGVVAIFGGLSLAVSLSYAVTRWITSLGAKKF